MPPGPRPQEVPTRHPAAPEDMNSWQIDSNEGDEWKVESLPGEHGKNFPDSRVKKYFVTSFGMCLKSQMIDLKAEGYWEELMDTFRPEIVVKDWFAPRADCGCTYHLRVHLTSANYIVLASFDPPPVTIEQWNDATWKERIRCTATSRNSESTSATTAEEPRLMGTPARTTPTPPRCRPRSLPWPKLRSWRVSVVILGRLGEGAEGVSRDPRHPAPHAGNAARAGKPHPLSGRIPPGGNPALSALLYDCGLRIRPQVRNFALVTAATGRGPFAGPPGSPGLRNHRDAAAEPAPPPTTPTPGAVQSGPHPAGGAEQPRGRGLGAETRLSDRDLSRPSGAPFGLQVGAIKRFRWPLRRIAAFPTPRHFSSAVSSESQLQSTAGDPGRAAASAASRESASRESQLAQPKANPQAWGRGQGRGLGCSRDAPPPPGTQVLWGLTSLKNSGNHDFVTGADLWKQQPSARCLGTVSGEPMAGSTVPKVPTLFLVLLLFPELHAAGTFASASSAQNLPDTPAHHPSSTLWMPQASHHGRRGPGKKDRGPGLSSRAQEGAVLTAPGQASRITLGQRPAGLLQDKEMLLGQALPYPEKEPRSSGWERMKKRGREHKRRRDRLRLHRGLTIATMVNINELPENILLELFTHVPARQLLRNCRLVCSLWRDLIDVVTLWKRKSLQEGFITKDWDQPVEDWKIFYFLRSLQRNLLRNPCAEEQIAAVPRENPHPRAQTGQLLLLQSAQHNWRRSRAEFLPSAQMECPQAFGVPVILLVHWLLTTWGCLLNSGSYAWSNFTILALGVWAVAQRDSVDAIGMFLGGLVATIFLDIIYISIFYQSLASSDTGRFSVGMAILSLLLKPFSCCLVYHMHRERGGELPLRPDFFGPSQEHSAYQTIDSSDSPAAPYAVVEDKGQAATRGGPQRRACPSRFKPGWSKERSQGRLRAGNWSQAPTLAAPYPKPSMHPGPSYRQPSFRLPSAASSSLLYVARPHVRPLHLARRPLGPRPEQWLPQGCGAKALTLPPGALPLPSSEAWIPPWSYLRRHHVVPRVWLSLFLIELKRPWRNLDISLGSRGGQTMPMRQAAIRSQGSVLCHRPYQVQSNLSSFCPRLAPALKDTTGQLGDPGLWQQSNLKLPAGRSQSTRAQEPFAQQSNLCFRGNASPHLRNSCLPPAGPPSHQRQTLRATDTLCLDLRLSGGLAPLDGCIWPGPRPWCASGSWAPRLVGEPLTLEDLSVCAHSQSWVSSRSSCITDHWLLDSIQHLEPVATRSRSPTCQEHPGPTHRRAHTRSSQSTPTQPWPNHPRESINLLETLRVQARLSESPVCKPQLHEATLGTLAGHFSDSDQEILSTQHLGARERGSPGLPYNKRNRGHISATREAGSREARLKSPTVFSALPRQAGSEKAPQEEAGWDGERMASRPSNTAPAQSTQQGRRVALQQKQELPGTQAASPPFLASRGSPSLGRKAAIDLAWKCRCFRAWQRFVQRGAQCRRHLAHQRGMQKRALQHILSQWHLRAWGPEPPSSSMETMLALQPWGNSPRGEAWLGLGTSGGPLEKVQVQQTQNAVRLYRRTLQRRYFQAWCEHVRDIGVSQDHCQAFQDDLRGDLGATFASSQEACKVGPQAQDPCVAQASVLGWRSFLQECGTDRQLRKAQAWQAFAVWRVSLGQSREAQQQEGRSFQVLSPVQVALCWVPWMHDSYLGQVHQAHAAQQLTSRVLEAWMQLAGQAHIHRADVTHCWWRLQCLFRTRWVQWLSTPLRWWLEPQTQAQNMDFRHWLRLANRGCLLQLDTPNFLIEAFEKWYQRLVARSLREELAAACVLEPLTVARI
ncbi:angiotensin II type I receptor-associated protein [Cricetulus griseus]